MTNKERDLIDILIKTPYMSKKNIFGKYSGNNFDGVKAGFLRNFTVDITQHPEYLKQLFVDVFNEKNNYDVEKLIILSGIFGLINEDLIDVLIKIILEPWHYWHESIASIFEQLKSPKTTDALFAVATNHYKYLDFELGHRMLQVQCIWSLGAINTKEAREKIIEIAQVSDDLEVKERAELQLRGERGSML